MALPPGGEPGCGRLQGSADISRGGVRGSGLERQELEAEGAEEEEFLEGRAEEEDEERYLQEGAVAQHPPWEDHEQQAVERWQALVQATRALTGRPGPQATGPMGMSTSLTIVVRNGITGKVLIGPEELRPLTTIRHLQGRLLYGLGMQFYAADPSCPGGRSAGLEILEEGTDLEHLAVLRAQQGNGTALELSAIFRSRYSIFEHEPGQVGEDEKTLLEELNNKFLVMEQLGSGSYGRVYKAMCSDSGTEQPHFVAIKMLPIEYEDEGIPVTALREVATLKMMNHPNVVGLDQSGGVYPTRKFIYIVLELLQMDLRSYLKVHKKFADPVQLRSSIHQCMAALLHCHTLGVIHRDLKPQNILVNPAENGDVVMKIADFGMARRYTVPLRPYTTEVVTLWYRAVELLLGESKCGTGLDMWSMACIIAEMATGEELFPGSSQIDMLYRIFQILGTPNEQVWPGVSNLPYYQGVFPTWPDTELVRYPCKVFEHGRALGQDGISLLRGCFTYNPQERISSRRAIRHEFFQDLPPAARRRR